MAFFDIPLTARRPLLSLRGILMHLRGTPRDPIARMQDQGRREEAQLAADRLLHRARGPF